MGYDKVKFVNDQGDIAWQSCTSQLGYTYTYQIHFYDSTTGEIITVYSSWNRVSIRSFNNRGDICFFERFDDPNNPQNPPTNDLFLYDTNTHLLNRLTNDCIQDTGGNLNEAGDLVWSKHDGSDYEIKLYQRATGAITQVTANPLNDSSPSINNNGDIAWTQNDGNDNEIMLYVKTIGTIEQITDDFLQDMPSNINANRDISPCINFDYPDHIFISSEYCAIFAGS